MKHRHLITLVAATTILFPTVAQAACPQTDAQGTWQAYSFVVTGEGYPDWSRCKLTVNASGVMAPTTCVYRHNGGATAALTQGHIALSPSCIFTAQFRLNGALNTVVHATLSKDKQSANGVGVAPQGGMFIFNLTKL